MVGVIFGPQRVSPGAQASALCLRESMMRGVWDVWTTGQFLCWRIGRWSTMTSHTSHTPHTSSIRVDTKHSPADSLGSKNHTRPKGVMLARSRSDPPACESAHMTSLGQIPIQHDMKQNSVVFNAFSTLSSHFSQTPPGRGVQPMATAVTWGCTGNCFVPPCRELLRRHFVPPPQQTPPDHGTWPMDPFAPHSVWEIGLCCRAGF